jgi:hypothetical protein
LRTVTRIGGGIYNNPTMLVPKKTKNVISLIECLKKHPKFVGRQIFLPIEIP